MPYRDRATVQRWIEEYPQRGSALRSTVSVLEQGFTPGPDSALVVVSLPHAPTLTYIQPIVTSGRVVWAVTFEARSETLTLGEAAVRQLADQFAEMSALCRYLQDRTDRADRSDAAGV